MLRQCGWIKDVVRPVITLPPRRVQNPPYAMLDNQGACSGLEMITVEGRVRAVPLFAIVQPPSLSYASNVLDTRWSALDDFESSM